MLRKATYQLVKKNRHNLENIKDTCSKPKKEHVSEHFPHFNFLKDRAYLRYEKCYSSLNFANIKVGLFLGHLLELKEHFYKEKILTKMRPKTTFKVVF